MEEKENKQKLDYREFWDWFLTMEKTFIMSLKKVVRNQLKRFF